MNQTRLQKLELLRKALIIATRMLFPEMGDDSIEVDVRFHHTKNSLRDEALSSGFKEEESGSTVWTVNKAYYGDIVIFK